MLTTGQAAKLCSVTPDTVLKWIRSGNLTARRTAGGHHRIDERDLKRFLVPTENGSAIPQPAASTTESESGVSRYCWEYNGKGSLPEGCEDCAVYQLRAQRCYEVLKLGKDIGHTKLFCKGDCLDCEYYRHVHLQDINVMVVTEDHALIASLEKEKETAPYSLEISKCEYTCSALVDTFRPDYVVVDCAFGPERSADICNHLIEDPRLPYVRVVLAVQPGQYPQGCNKEVFARIERPFDVSHITECIHGAMN
jgi:excisionase family DNA binding protein